MSHQMHNMRGGQREKHLLRSTGTRDGHKWLAAGEIVLVADFISPSMKSFQVVTEK